MINLNFIITLPRSRRKHNSIWMILDRIRKLTHFLPVKTTDSLEYYAMSYLPEVVRHHAIFLTIISDRDEQFTTQFGSYLKNDRVQRVTYVLHFVLRQLVK